MIDLLRSLVRIALGCGGQQETARLRGLAGAARPREWERVRETLELHRIIPLMARVCRSGPVGEVVPSTIRSWALAAHRKTLLTNTVLLRELDRALRALRARGIDPILLKGAVLVDQVYPDPGMRFMGDVDFLLEADEMERAEAVARELDYWISEPVNDAVHLCSRSGVTFDVHRRFRIFEDKLGLDLATRFEPRLLESGPYRAFEPNAMLVHLSFHADDHRPDMGHLLRWLLDMAFFMLRWGGDLDRELLQRLCPSERCWKSMLRNLGFLNREFGVELPAELAHLCTSVPRYTLAELLRGRRVIPWALNTPRGWAKMVASRLRIVSRQGRVHPHLTDLLLWPIDALRQWRALS